MHDGRELLSLQVLIFQLAQTTNGSVGNRHDVIVLHKANRLVLSDQRIQLYLIDYWFHATITEKIGKKLYVEI